VPAVTAAFNASLTPTDAACCRELAQLRGCVDYLRRNLQEDPLIFKLEVHGDTEVLPGPKCTLGFELEGCHVSKIYPGGPAFASRQIAEGDLIIEVDGRPATLQNIVGFLIGDDTEGSTCRLRLAKASKTDAVEVLIRRARTDIVQEQEMAFDYLSELKNHAVESGDVESAEIVENLGRQFVRILLDRQDKELALSVQHKGLQDDSLRCLDEIREGVQALASRCTSAGEDANRQQVRKLEGEVTRHVGVEEELQKLNEGLERQLESAHATEVELNQRILDQQRVIDQSGEMTLHLQGQIKMSQQELEQAHQLTAQLHASLEQETGLKRALADRCRELEGLAKQSQNDNFVSVGHLDHEDTPQLAHSRGQEMQKPHDDPVAERLRADNVRLQDEVYHKEEALWLARQELRTRDKRIKEIEREFEDLQQMLSQFSSLSSTKLAAVTEERNKLKSQLDKSLGLKADAGPDNETINGEVSDNQKQGQGLRYMPTPPATPVDRATFQTMAAVVNSNTDKRVEEISQILEQSTAGKKSMGESPERSRAAPTSMMNPISPDQIRPQLLPGSLTEASKDLGMLPITAGPQPGLPSGDGRRRERRHARVALFACALPGMD